MNNTPFTRHNKSKGATISFLWGDKEAISQKKYLGGGFLLEKIRLRNE